MNIIVLHLSTSTNHYPKSALKFGLVLYGETPPFTSSMFHPSFFPSFLLVTFNFFGSFLPFSFVRTASIHHTMTIYIWTMEIDDDGDNNNNDKKQEKIFRILSCNLLSCLSPYTATTSCVSSCLYKIFFVRACLFAFASMISVCL